MKKHLVLAIVLLVILSACGPSPEEQAAMTATSITATAAAWTKTPTPTFTFTPTLTATQTPTLTLTPSITPSPTITSTPTFSYPTFTVNKQAHCRYGPSVAFLHAADLYAGDTGIVKARFEYSNWLYVRLDKLSYSCWVAPSVIDVVGDVSKLFTLEPDLQSVGYSHYAPPKNITTTRSGDELTISWDQVEMTTDHDRGYLIVAFVCQNGAYLWWTFSYPDQFTTSYTVHDEAGCPQPSEGVLYTVEKHGFSKPAKIPWIAP